MTRREAIDWARQAADTTGIPHQVHVATRSDGSRTWRCNRREGSGRSWNGFPILGTFYPSQQSMVSEDQRVFSDMLVEAELALECDELFN